MADIILPQVNTLSSASSNTNLLVESNGEIYRLNIENLSSNDSTIDADTLQGYNASYFATASSLSSLQSSNNSAHNTFNSSITTLQNDVNTINSSLTTLNDEINALKNNKVLLYNNPTEDGRGEFYFSITQANLELYEYLEFACWTYIENVGWWYEPVLKIRVDDLISSSTNDGWSSISIGDVLREIWFENSRVYVSQGYWNDGSSDNAVLVPERIWGIKKQGDT